MAAHRARSALAALGVVLAAGCASFSDSFYPIERALGAHDPQAALRVLERQLHLPNDQVVYLLNKGMLLRMTGDLKASTEAFETAKRRIDAFYAASLTEQAASFIINDATRSYSGEPYEQVLLHVYLALNYLELGLHDEARVEALQADLRLREHAQSLGKRYHDDPLARYVAGKIFESRGERSDAMIAFRKAYEAYRERRTGAVAPQCLGNDLVRLSRALGLREELETYRSTFGDVPDAAANQGEVIVLLHEGLAPIKHEHAATALSPETGRLVRVSLPAYQRRSTALRGARVLAAGKQTETALLEDVGATAVQDLEAQMPLITARAIARAVAKDRTAKQAAKQDAAVGLAVNIVNVLTERADTRSWLTLPDRVHVATLALPPGRHAVTVELLGFGGQVVATHTFPEVTVVAGRKHFLSHHWVSPLAGS